TLGRRNEAFAICLTAGFFQRLVDDVHAVVAADRTDVGVALELGVVGRHEVLVDLGVVIEVVVPGGNDAERRVTHVLDRALVGYLPRANDFDLARIDTAFGERLAERGRLSTARNEYENRFRIEILRALHERGKVGIGYRHA